MTLESRCSLKATHHVTTAEQPNRGDCEFPPIQLCLMSVHRVLQFQLHQVLLLLESAELFLVNCMSRRLSIQLPRSVGQLLTQYVSIDQKYLI